MKLLYNKEESLKKLANYRPILDHLPENQFSVAKTKKVRLLSESPGLQLTSDGPQLLPEVKLRIYTIYLHSIIYNTHHIMRIHACSDIFVNENKIKTKTKTPFVNKNKIKTKIH